MIQLPDIERKTQFHPYIKPLKIVTPASKHKFAYYFLTRSKKHHPWQCVAFVYVAGDCCSAVATDYFANYGYVVNHPLSCIVDANTWRKFQATQHLKSVKMNK